MPSPSTSDLPRPKSWDEFEDICADLLKRLWNDPFVVRNGRSGQRQFGVDIYGQPKRLIALGSNTYAACQCKDVDHLSIDAVAEQVENATEFTPQLAEYIFMTTAPRDAVLQRDVRSREWPFRVHVMFWDDISLELSGHEDLLQKHFSGWMKRTTSQAQIYDLLCSSQPGDFDYDDSTGVYTHKGDIKLRIMLDRTEASQQLFEEPWAKKFSGITCCQPVYIHYGDSRVFTHFSAYVDGGRHIVPYPKTSTDLTIDKFQYHLGQILNYPIPGRGVGLGFDHALRVAGITVRSE